MILFENKSYKIKKISEIEAKEIMSWEYEYPYSFYNIEAHPGEMKEMLNGSYFSVLTADDSLAGFVCFGESAQVPGGVRGGHYKSEGAIDIGLGLKPDLTGQGKGLEFIETCMEFGVQQFDSHIFRISVANFNKRAISVYRKAGFKLINTFINRTSDGESTFTLMEKS